jgi:hypothetical protein
VKKRVLDPIEKTIEAYHLPSLSTKKRNKLRPDYEKYLSGKIKFNTKLKLKLVDQYKSLNKNLEIELPKLRTLTREIGKICSVQFIGLQTEWYSTWQMKIQAVLGQLPEDISDIIVTYNRDFNEVEPAFKSLRILDGTLLDHTTEGKALSQPTTRDSAHSSNSFYYTDPPLNLPRHHNPTKLSEPLEEDERSRTSASSESGRN